MMNQIRAFLRDKRGATAILSGLTFFILIGFGAFALDFSNFYFLKRKQQGASDLAAIAGAADIANARKAVAATLSQNGYEPTSLQSVELGTFSPDPTLAPADRFKPAETGNAVRITVLTRAPFYLAHIFGMTPARAAGEPDLQIGNGMDVRTVSVAAQDSTADFSLGSRLLKLDGGVLNGLLGRLIGANLSLSVMDYQALASVNLDLFSFAKALAVRTNLTAATYDTLFKSQLRIGDIYAALADTARGTTGGGTAASALATIAQAKSGSSEMMTLTPLLSFGPYGSLPVSGKAPMTAMINALDIASLTAQIANGKRQIQVGLNIAIPGLAGASLQLGIGERPVGTSAVAVDAVGASVHTAQTRLLLSVQVLGTGQASLVTLPLYLELAAGTARLTSITCSPGDISTSTVALGVTPSVIDAWIGAVSNTDFNNMTYAPSTGPATLLNLVGLATVTGRAHVNIGNMAAKTVSFSYSDIQGLTKKTVTTTDFTTSLTARLLGNLQLKVNVLGLGLGLPTGLDAAVLQTLQQATVPVDQLLASLLGTLGIGLGQADAWVGGVRCGNAVLVN